MTRLLLSFAVAASCAACASILDFQEATDKLTVSPAPDAGHAPTAPSSTLTTETVPLVAPRADASVDAAVDAAVDASVVEACACPPTASADWQGPFVIATSTTGDVPPCAGAYATEVFAGVSGSSAPDAQCGCSCGAPTEVTCSTPTTTLFSDAACTSTCQSLDTALTCVSAASYSCVGLAKPRAVTVGASTPAGGSCLPTASVTVAPPTWATSVRLCSGDAMCGDGGCPAAPSPGFSATNRCVMKAGAADCPAAYPVKQELHQGGTDTRACTACTCGAPTDVACDVPLATFGVAPCNGTPTPLTAPLGCTTLAGSTRFTVGLAAPEGGSCLAAGGVATGAFIEDAPTTVCCLE